MTRTEYTESLERDYTKALNGGAEMLNKALELEDKAKYLINNNPVDSEEHKEGMRILGIAEMLNDYWNKMFW